MGAVANRDSYKPFKKGHYLIDTLLLILICMAGFSCYFTYDIPATIDVDINLNLGISVDQFMAYFYTAYSLPSALSAMMSGYIISWLGLGRGGMILAVFLTLAHLLLGLSMYTQSALLACLGRVLHGTASEPFGVVRSAFTAKYFNSALFYGLILAFSRAGSVGGIKLTPIILCYFKNDSPSCTVAETTKIKELFNRYEESDNIENFNETELLIVKNFFPPDFKDDMDGTIVGIGQSMKNVFSITDPNSQNPSTLSNALVYCFLAGVAVSFLAILLMAAIHTINNYLDKKRGLNESENEIDSKGLSLRDMKKIPINAWALIYIFTVWYSAMFPFNSMLPGYMKTHCGYSKDVAANLASIVYAFSVVGSPTMGYVIDKTKHHTLWLFLSSALLVSTFIAWGYLQPRTDKDTMVYIMTGMMCVLGVAYSIIASSLMAYLADVTPLRLHSTAFGLLFGVQQLGVGTTSWFAGKFCKNIGYAMFPYLLAGIGIFATIGNVYLIFRDGVNPLKKPKKPSLQIQDVTISRHSCRECDAATRDDEIEMRTTTDFNRDEDNPFL